jgi:uncharacterized protein YciI
VSEAAIRPDAPMCVVLLDYVAPLDAIDAALPRHGEWLTAGFAAGHILTCGRRVPRTGGVIVMRGDADSVAALSDDDPFIAEGLATRTVIPFTAGMATTALQGFFA